MQAGNGGLQSWLQPGITSSALNPMEYLRAEELVLRDVDAIAGCQQCMIKNLLAAIVGSYPKLLISCHRPLKAHAGSDLNAPDPTLQPVSSGGAYGAAIS